MARRPTDSPLRWFLAGIVLLFVASALVSAGAVAVQGSRNADAAADEILDRIATRTADLIDGHLQPATVSLSQLSLAMQSPEQRSITSQEHLLATQLVTMPEVSGAYIAYPDGSFHFVRRDDDGNLVLKRITHRDGERQVVEGPLDGDLQPEELADIDDDFDPRSRVWYQAAVDRPDEVAWTDPYVFFASKEPGVTTSTAILDDDGEVAAVVGIDVTLTALSDFMQDLPIDATAEGFIVAEGLVLAAPSNPVVVTTDGGGSVSLATTEDLGLDEDAARVATTELQADGLPAWSIVVRVDRIDYVEAVKRQSRVALGAVGLAVVVGLGLLATLGLRMRRPIDELTTLADRDPLTDLPNRRAVLAFGRSTLRRAIDDDADLTVAMLDIDSFKAVNDRYGHVVGDDALRRVSAALSRSVRPGDMVGRYGGDEFVVILSNSDQETAIHALTRITNAAEQELRASPETSGCTLSAGVATRRGRSIDFTALVAEADAELIEVKRSRDRDPDEPTVSRS